jgi:hypothetical protein
MAAEPYLCVKAWTPEVGADQLAGSLLDKIRDIRARIFPDLFTTLKH